MASSTAQEQDAQESECELANVLEQVRDGRIPSEDAALRISSAKASPQGIGALMEFVVQEPNEKARCAALDGLAQMLAASSRGQFSAGETSFVFPDAYLCCSMDSQDALSVPPLKLSALRGYTFSGWFWFEEATSKEHMNHQRVLYRFLTTHGYGSWCMVDLEASTIEVRTRSHGELGWQRASFTVKPGVLQPRQWIHISVAHSQPYLVGPILSVYIDGVLRHEGQLAYPKLEEHATENFIGQGLGGRFARPTLFEGAASSQQALELFVGASRMRVAVPLPRASERTLDRSPRSPSGPENMEVNNNEIYIRRQFSLARAGHLTTEAVAEIRANLLNLVKLAPRALHDASSTSSGTNRWRSLGDENADDPVSRHEFQQRLKLHKQHQYEDLIVVFHYDARTCIGGALEDEEMTPNRWKAVRVGGVLETVHVNGRRTSTHDREVFVEPQSLSFAKSLDGVSYGMPSRSMQVYARCLGSASVVFDLDISCSLECAGGVFPLLIALVNLVPLEVKVHAQLLATDGTAPATSSDSHVLVHLVRVLNEALFAREFYREDFSHLHGFALLGWVLHHLPRSYISEELAEALWDFVLRVGSVDISLRCEGLLYVLFDHQTWGGSPEETQRCWMRRMVEYVQKFPAEARIAVGVQTVLDILAIAEFPRATPTDGKSAPPVDGLEGNNDDRKEAALDEAPPSPRATPRSNMGALSGLEGDFEEDSDDAATERGDEEEDEQGHGAQRPRQQSASPRDELNPDQVAPPWISPACVEDLVKVIRLFFSAPGYAEVEAPKSPGDVRSTASGPGADDEWDSTAVSTSPGPASAEVQAIFNFASRMPTAHATTLLLDTFDYMLLPLLVTSRVWSSTETAIARATYDAIQASGGVDFLLALGSRSYETTIAPAAVASAAAANLAKEQAGDSPSLKRDHSFKILGRLKNRPPELQASIKPVDSFGSASKTQGGNENPQDTAQGLGPPQVSQATRNGLLCSSNGVPDRTRAAMVLLAGRMVQLEERIDLAATIRERAGGRGDQAARIIEVNKLRRQKQFGIVLRSIMPVTHVASFKLGENEVYKVSREANASVLDAIVSVIMGSAAQWEGVDDFVPHDDTMELAVPDALPVLGGMLAALSKADEETKSIAAREILLKLSLVMKASYAAREQVTSLPRWQTWLIPVMLLQDKSLNHEDDNSADYLLAEVSIDLLCTLMEHETQRPDDSKAEASKLNRVQYGWAAWQGLAESAMRILKEKERSLIADHLQEAKSRTDPSARSLVPEYNSVAELRATEKTSRVLRQTLERVWERLVVRLQAGGLHGDAVRNFTFTIAMSEEILLTGLNLLRLCPLSPGGMIGSSSASTFVCAPQSNTAAPLSCSARCVIDGRHDTKWVDVARTIDDDGASGDDLPTTQSWIQYKYPSFSFQDPKERIARTRHRVVFYSVRSAFDMAELDPSGWTLFGRNSVLMEGEQGGWTVLDRRSEVRFATRYQQINCWVQNTGFFEEYRVVFDPPARRGKVLRQQDGQKAFVKLHLGELSLFECDVDSWHFDLATTRRDEGTETIIDAHLQERALVAAAIQENNGELLRFVRLALQTIKFIRSGSAHGSTPRMNRRQYRQNDESEAKAQVHDMPKRAMIRCLGHFLRNAAVLPLAIIEETISLVRSFLADDLATEVQGNRTLILVLIHCIHNGLCHLQALQNGSLSGSSSSSSNSSEDATKLAAEKVDALFALLDSAVSVHPGNLLSDDRQQGHQIEAPESIDAFLQEWSDVWALPVQRALQRELEAEALHRHTSFRVERSSSTAMARRANPVEVAAYGAGRDKRPVGLPRTTRKRLSLLDKSEEERIYTNQIVRITVRSQAEHQWRKLAERYEIAQIVHRGLDSSPHHRLFRTSPFVEPSLRVRTRLLRNPGGNPHYGAASGVKDRIQRQRAKEAEARSLGDGEEAHEKDDKREAESAENGPENSGLSNESNIAEGEAGAPGQDTEVDNMEETMLKRADTAHEELGIQSSTSWENIGAKLSKQINITDTSLMTRQDDEDDIEGEDAEKEKEAAQQKTTTSGSKATSITAPARGGEELSKNKNQASTSDPNTADSDDAPVSGASEDGSEAARAPGSKDAHEGSANTSSGGIVLDQRSMVKKVKRPPSVVTSVLQKSAAAQGALEDTGPSGPHEDAGETAGSLATLSPTTPPTTPAPLESQRKLTMEEWVNRSPDPIRGESMEPWPPQHEQIFSASRCSWVRPEFEVPGRLLVTQEAMYFDPDPPNASKLFLMRASDADDEDPQQAKDRELELASIKRCQEELPEHLFEHQLSAWRRFELRKQKQRHRKVWRLRDLDCILMRRFKMRDSAMEIFVQGQANESFFFNFEPRLACTIIENVDGSGLDVREKIIHGGLKERHNVVHHVLSVLPSEVRRRSQRPGEPTRRLVDQYTERWQRREISNFEYLVRLNIFAGRSINDLTQYPVFPWVLSDYESEELNLQDPAVYRDLSKPMGALTEDRLMEARERYHTFDDPNTPKFHYGSHYSTMAGVVLYFLVRTEPFTSLHITMQDGHFDIPDRLFGSVPGTWRMCTTAMSEVKELTPEFYCMPEFLTNHNQFDLGTLQDGTKVGDVELPPWAKGSPHRFITKMRMALESEYVSRNLHHWVDLIFGHKARLPDAVEADNVFYYLTYPGAVDLDSIDDPAMRLATELQVKHFGQCPEQIFTRPHPTRGGPTRPPFPLSVAMSGTFASDRFNADGRNTSCVSSESGTVCAVHLLEGRIMVVHDSGDMCSFVWGRSELANRRDSESTVDEEEYLSESDAPLEGRRRNVSSSGSSRPFIVLPAPEAFETQNEAEKELFCPPVHHLPVTSVRRQLRWAPSAPSTSGMSAKSGATKPAQVVVGRDVVLASRADGRVLAHAGQGIGAVEVYFIDADSGYFRAWSATLFAHTDDVTALALSSGSLVSGAADGSLRVWALRESAGPLNNSVWGVANAPRLSLSGHAAAIDALAVSDRQQVVVSASENMCLVHSIFNGQLLGKCEQASKERPTLVRISDMSGRIVVFAQATRTMYLYSTSRIAAPLAAVQTEGIVRDLVLSRQNLGLRSAELVLSVGEGKSGQEVVARSCDDDLCVKGIFDVWPEEETASPLMTLGLDPTEEALAVGAADGSICVFPLPNFVSSGPDAKIAMVGAMDVNARIQHARNAVMTKIDSARVLATARGVATEAAGVATKIGKGFLSVFGGK